MLELNPHRIDLNIFKNNKVFFEECVSTGSNYLDVDIKYYKHKDKNVYAKIKAYTARQEALICYLKLKKNQNEVMVCDVQQEGFDFLIIRDEYKLDTIFVNLDIKTEVHPELYYGTESSANESYIDYFNCFKSQWVNFFKVDENIIGIEVEEKSGNQLYTIKYNLEKSDPYFLVQPSNDIKVYGDVNLFWENGIIRVVDYPVSDKVKRERLFLCMENAIVSIVNKSNLDYDQLVLILLELEEPKFTQYSPEKRFRIEVFRKEKIIIRIIDAEELDFISFLIYDIEYSEGLKEIFNFSNPINGKDSKYFVMKKSINDIPVVINLYDKEVTEYNLNDTVFSNSSIHKDISISDSGNYLCIIGDVMRKIPYFNVYRLNSDKSIAKRVINRYATLYKSDVDSVWEKDVLVLLVDNNGNYPKFEMRDGELMAITNSEPVNISNNNLQIGYFI